MSRQPAAGRSGSAEPGGPGLTARANRLRLATVAGTDGKDPLQVRAFACGAFRTFAVLRIPDERFKFLITGFASEFIYRHSAPSLSLCNWPKLE